MRVCVQAVAILKELRVREEDRLNKAKIALMELYQVGTHTHMCVWVCVWVCVCVCVWPWSV